MYFCAPEQTQLPPRVTTKSDIYSLGKILYYMITGQKSKDDENTISIKDVVKHPKIDEVDKLFLEMVSFDPKNRISNVKDIITKIDSILDLPPVKSEFQMTVLQFRILKFIKSFEYGKVSFKKILDYILPFYDVDLSGGIFPIMFSGKIKRSEFIDTIETSLEILEEQKYISFKDGEYQYMKKKIKN